MNSKKVYLAMVFVAILLSISQPGCGHDKDDNNNQGNDMFAEFNNYAVKAMNDWQVPGMAVAIVQGNTVLFQKAYGVKKMDGADPVTLNTLFQIGSASKSFTTTLMAMDVSEGKYKWNDKVITHLPDFQMFDPWVTSEFQVVDLSAQHSGMPSYAADGAMVLGFDRAHIRHVIRYVKPIYSFRTTGTYVNNLFMVDGALVEKYSGKSWEDNIRERIFTPLGMTHSSMDRDSFINAPDVANLHHRIGERVVPLPMDWKFMNWPYNAGPAGGINSNIIDMVNYVRLHFNNGSFNGRQLIKEENAIFVHSPKTIGRPVPNQPMAYYCQGWQYREYNPHAIIWHNGETSGIKSIVAFMPEAKLGIVVLTNLDGTKVPESLAWKFFDLYFGHPARDWSAEELEKAKKARAQEEANRPTPPPDPEPPLSLDKYEGTYYNPVYEEVQVTRQMDQLLVTVGPLQANIFLRNWDGNTFMGSWDTFTVIEDIGLVSFEVNGAGVPVKMTINYLNDDGCGVFQRI